MKITRIIIGLGMVKLSLGCAVAERSKDKSQGSVSEPAAIPAEDSLTTNRPNEDMSTFIEDSEICKFTLPIEARADGYLDSASYLSKLHRASGAASVIKGEAKGVLSSIGTKSPTLALWSSQLGFNIHQLAIHQTLGGKMPEESLWILVNSQHYADTFQTPEDSFRHAMRAPEQSVADAEALSLAFIKKQFSRSWQLLDCGKGSESLWEFGIGLHVLQDATSPSHNGFQVWDGGHSKLDAASHVVHEIFDPGEDSNLYKVSMKSWDWYQKRELPLTNLFTLHGADSDKKPPTPTVTNYDFGLISDIDDTIKISAVKNPLKLIQASLANHEFYGLSRLYNLFYETKKDARQVFYVSGAPEAEEVSILGKVFLAHHMYPQPEQMYPRKSLKEVTEEHKVAKIRELILASGPKAKFVLVGDNGERDVYAYARIVQEFPTRILKTLIHQAYLPNEQKAEFLINKEQERYLTSADLAVQFHAIGLIDNDGLSKVLDNSISEFPKSEDRVIPSWMKEACVDFLENRWPLIKSDAALQEKLNQVKQIIATLSNCAK